MPHIARPGSVRRGIFNSALAKHRQREIDSAFRKMHFRDRSIRVQSKSNAHFANRFSREMPVIQQIEPATLNCPGQRGVVRAELSRRYVERWDHPPTPNPAILFHFL